MKLYKYHGAGNDFLIGDNRAGDLRMDADKVRALCNRHTGFGADGVMLLENSLDRDFRMVFFNPDGSGGMMCGNGGRCIVAFAADLGIASFDFEAPDGPHSAAIIQDGNPKIVRLDMKDVLEAERLSEDSFFLDTGTRHVVKFVQVLDNYDVCGEGRRIRHDSRFAPAGTNVNFAELTGDGVRVRTFEKGVEGETLACGTGIVATAIASCLLRGDCPNGAVSVKVSAAIASLQVDFAVEASGHGFSGVRLTGPAEYVGSVDFFGE